MYLGECQGAYTPSALLPSLCPHFLCESSIQHPGSHMSHGGGERGVPSYDVIVIVSDQRHIVVQINTRLQSGFELLVSVL